MSEQLIGNVLVAQSGGPTAVINASLAGVIEEALNHDCIEEIYGGLNGIQGIMNEQLIDLAEESQQAIRGLKYTPASALGTCRYKIKHGSKDYNRILEVLEAHNIRYFFYIGGNDSQDTADQISQLAEKNGYQLRVVGIPKTVDNDLVSTDHCPGYGSAVKYICTTLREISKDHEAMGQHDLVSIVEVMGRNAGWLAAGASLAKERNLPDSPPHLIYLPEIRFNADKLVADVQTVLSRNKFCLIVVSEGLMDAEGNYVAANTASTDAFGHSALGGAAEYLKSVIEDQLDIKARTIKLGYTQRAATTHASKTDRDEAYMCGVEAVKAAISGDSGVMISMTRSETGETEYGLAPLSKIANGVKHVPENWINEDGVSLNQSFIKYATPLIQGEVEVPYENGLPAFVKLRKNPVHQVLSHYTAAGKE